MKSRITLRVNGKTTEVYVDPKTPLLYVLRNNLALNGPKFGCGLEQCGACMVLLDNKSNPSCRIPVEDVADKDVTTLEGLISKNGKLHKVQEAFIEEQAVQCGYCTNGLIISSVSLLKEKPKPTEKEIRDKLEPNICRCGVHYRVIKAVKKASL